MVRLRIEGEDEFPNFTDQGIKKEPKWGSFLFPQVNGLF